MSGIKFVITTELFWKTLADYRRHGNYGMLRDKIDETIFHKVENRHFRTQADKPFDPTSKMKNIWHTHLSKEFDAVLFYTVSGDDLTLAMIGNHGDYPNGGKGKSKEAPFTSRIWRAVESGHVPSPAWKKVKWAHPSELLACRDLHEVDVRTLAEIREELREELETLARFDRVTGTSHKEPKNIDAVIEYIEAVEKADDLLAAASVRAQMSFEKHLRATPVKELSFGR